MAKCNLGEVKLERVGLRSSPIAVRDMRGGPLVSCRASRGCTALFLCLLIIADKLFLIANRCGFSLDRQFAVNTLKSLACHFICSSKNVPIYLNITFCHLKAKFLRIFVLKFINRLFDAQYLNTFSSHSLIDVLVLWIICRVENVCIISENYKIM